MKIPRAALIATIAAGLAQAAYSPFIYSNNGTFGTDPYTHNGTSSFTSSTGLTSSSATGGSYIYSGSALSGQREYEVHANYTLAASGGIFVTYLEATSNALAGVSGSYYAIELSGIVVSGSTCTANLSIVKSVSGTTTTLSTAAIACRTNNDGTTTIRAIYGASNQIFVYTGPTNVLTAYAQDSSVALGSPGFGVANSPSTNYINFAEIYQPDVTSPPAINPQMIGASPFPNHVDLQWPGVVDNTGGSGIAYYQISRDGVFFRDIDGPVFTDNTVAASTDYAYEIYAVDYYGNQTTTSIAVATPPAGYIDPQEIGVRPLGSYWGAAGEQIDMRSGNVNYSVPLLRPMGRGGTGATFSLSYNSQNWRHDAGGEWQFGRDLGYGYGWTLQAGSLLPVWYSMSTIGHYLFTDSTGATYHLYQNGSGTWTSSEGIYVAFNSTNNTLYFPDGSFWVMGCNSGGTEQDAGTLYPTVIEDTNGNQIDIAYETGVMATAPNSSGRIASITDLRAVSPAATYTFTYNADAIPHLTSITNTIQTGEAYTFTINDNLPLTAPFTPATSFGNWSFLASFMQTGTGVSTAFTYDSANSGELDQVTTPLGGGLGWVYANTVYPGTRTQREVTTRNLILTAGATPLVYPIAHETTITTPVHAYGLVQDASGAGQKIWSFQNTIGSVYLGLATYFDSRVTSNTDNGATVTAYTWTTGTQGSPYVSTSLTTLDNALSTQVQKQTNQTLDAYGNVTQRQIFDYGNLTTPLRTYSYTYVTDPNYISRNITNRLLTSKVTDGTNIVTLLTNTYDVGTLVNPTTTPPMHDSAYGTSFTYRGNVTTAVTLVPTVNYTYDITGTALTQSRLMSTGTYLTLAATLDSTNTLPASITPNSNSALASNTTYSAFLGLVSATPIPSQGTASVTYDGAGRTSTVQSLEGATTTYTYNLSSLPPNIKASTNNHWTQNTLDGFGRVTLTTQADTSGTNSNVQTVYTAAGVSPLGMKSQVSEPYVGTPPTVGSLAGWTTYAYDGLGRTTSVTIADGSSKTQYAYTGAATKTTDPAGSWKQAAVNVFSDNLTVTEPNPVTPGQTYVTNYTYDLLDHLIQVSMARPASTGTVTQTRAFNYVNSSGAITGLLQSETNPESGTTTYTHKLDGTLSSRTDAKGQLTTYQHDGLERVTAVHHFPNGVTEDPCQLVTSIYDQNTLAPLGGYGLTNIAGRLVASQFGGATCPSEYQFTEFYSYNHAGDVTGKTLWLYRGDNYVGLSATFGYDTEGTLTSTTYPLSGPTYTYGLDNSERPITLKDNQSTPVTWVNAITYGPNNNLASFSQWNGTAYWAQTRSYNATFQMTGQSVSGVMNMQYQFSPTQNNGKITSKTDNITGETVTYSYDSLNELSSASSSLAWGINLKYDGFGNRTNEDQIPGKSGPTADFTYGTPTNPNNRNNAYTYDLNGNVTQMGTNSYAYDVENRLVSYNSSELYAYGAGNHRVWKKTPSGTEEIYFWTPGGQKLGTYTPTDTLCCSGAYSIAVTTKDTNLYFGKMMIVSRNSPLLRDRTGSTRISGTTSMTFYPYGEEQTSTSNDTDKYATSYRDATTGLDYAVNRYYNSLAGTFLTADPNKSSERLGVPLSWNRYVYALNDPINGNDPTGLDCNGFSDGMTFYSGDCPSDDSGSFYGASGTQYGVGSPAPADGSDSFQFSATTTNDVSISATAQAVFAQLNEDNPEGFINFAALAIGTATLDGELAATAAVAGAAETVGLAAAAEAAELAGGEPASGITFLGQENGPAIPVPNGASGPYPADNGQGMVFEGGQGGNGLAGNVNGVRVMDPNMQYPQGYANYGSAQANGGWQSINPYIGQPVPPGNPWWHIPLGPF